MSTKSSGSGHSGDSAEHDDAPGHSGDSAEHDESSERKSGATVKELGLAVNILTLLVGLGTTAVCLCVLVSLTRILAYTQTVKQPPDWCTNVREDFWSSGIN